MIIGIFGLPKGGKILYAHNVETRENLNIKEGRELPNNSWAKFKSARRKDYYVHRVNGKLHVFKDLSVREVKATQEIKDFFGKGKGQK